MIEVKIIKFDLSALEKYAANLGASIDRALSGLAHQVEGEAKELAPVDTGALKNSIHTEKIKEADYIVADGVEYGIYQELGTYKMSAQPFLIPAMEHVENELAKMVEKELPK